ncbi:DegT/DnrJ/EryC1/StrS family aminotransferase [bacterium]|nr:DegT/DnrJ/EryC1/StrS family aminotransferase [bacterium]
MQRKSQLVLLGGPKAVQSDYRDIFKWPIITQEDESAVLEVLRRGAMSGTDVTEQFEKEFATWQGTKFALAFNNGTAALQSAMFGCKVSVGNEIICPSVTYWASALPCFSLGATVVFADIDPETLDDVKALAVDLNVAGKVLHEGGKVFTYHNHQIEFRRFEGRLMLEVLYEETDPRYLQGEIDTYWVQYGGGDPVAWCKQLKDRLPLLHMKDYIITAENKPAFAEIGCGNFIWKEIVTAAEKSGCEWFIIEQDVCSGDPFQSLKLSFEYVKGSLCF